MQKQGKQEVLWVNLLCNVVAPALILSKATGEGKLSPTVALVIALMFPLGYGAYDFVKNKSAGFMSVVGFLSTLATGGFGLMELSGEWFAIKEAAVPSIIGAAVVLSLKAKRPLVRTFLMNDQVMDVARVEGEVEKRGQEQEFERLLKHTTFLLAASFLVSAVLNYVLAIMILKSPAGTEAFNAELGKMTALSYPVIVLPSMAMTFFALWWLVRGLKKMTGLDFDSIFHKQPSKGDASKSLSEPGS